MSENILVFQTIHSLQIHLNSSQATVYKNDSKKSKVLFELLDAVPRDLNILECKVGLVNAQIPYSFYNVNDTNNKFYMNGSLYGINANTYNIDTLIDNLTSNLPSGFSITYYESTHKLKFTYTSYFQLYDSGIKTSAMSILGFSTNTIYYSGLNYGLWEIVAPYPFNLNTFNRIHIATDSFFLKNVDSYNKTTTNILATIPVNTTPYDIIQYENKNNFRSNIHNIEGFYNLEINIYDDNENDIDFRNVDWTLTLQVDLLVEKILNREKLEDIIKYGFDSETDIN